MDLIKAYLRIAVCVAVTAVLLTGGGWLLYKTFAPRYEDARREVFEETKSYNQGMIQELQNMQFEYTKASPEHKQALRSIILHRAADFDEHKLPNDLRVFISELKNNGGRY